MTDHERPRYVTTRVRIDELEVIPALKPPDDLVFQYLYDRALRGELPVYFGAVPPALIDPFDASFHPETHPVGREVVESICDQWRSGKFSFCWVYPRNDRYVLADDYLSLAAVRRGNPDYMPCLILGDQILSGVKDAQGPLALELVRKHAGLT